MSNTVLLLLSLSALGHASWNAISARITERDRFFTLMMMISVILYGPVAILLTQHNSIPGRAWYWCLGSVLFEVLYFVALAKTYRSAPLTSTYPIARGISPVLATLFSFLVVRSPIGAYGLAGILLIAAGILLVNQTPSSRIRLALLHPGTRWALLTGTCTATYSVFDSLGATSMSGVLFTYLVYVGVTIGKIAVDLKVAPGTSYLSILKRYPIQAFAGGTVIFAVNALVLYCLQSTPVAYVSAVREMGIIFTTLIGLVWLKEKLNGIKCASIASIICGIVLIKLG